MSTLPSPSFCIIPWVHVFGDERGLLRPCCRTQNAQSRTIQHTGADGAPLTVYRRGDVAAGWQSPLMRDLRQSMLEGREPAICADCYSEERMGIRSYRQQSNEVYAQAVTGAVAGTARDGTAPLGLVRSLDVRLGNACNLQCRMCSPVSSKLLIPEWRQIYNVGDDDPKLNALEQVNWFDSDEFWDNCEELLPGLEQLHFAGGEPMIIARMLDFLQRVIELGHAEHISLSYVTNLTTLPDRVTELWPKFKRVTLTGSLDGPPAINHYIRYPARWDRIDTHLKRLAREPDRFNCDTITFNTTVQAYNILYLPELFEELLPRHAPCLSVYPRLTPLTWPSFFSIQVLPPELKALAEQRLRAFVRKWEGRWPETGPRLDNFLSSIDGIVAHMHDEDRSRELPDFAARTRLFDGTRGQDIRVVMPEWAPYLEPAPATP